MDRPRMRRAGLLLALVAGAITALVASRPREALAAPMHPVSRRFLDASLEGRLSAPAFRRALSLPDPSYLPPGECPVQMVG